MSEQLTVWVGGNDVTNLLIGDTLRWTEYEGGQVGALSLEITHDPNVSIQPWMPVTVEYAGYSAWAGFVIRCNPQVMPGGALQWNIQCEFLTTLLDRSVGVQHTYVNYTVAGIIADLFARAEIYDIDPYSGVSGTLTAPTTFSVNKEKMSDILDRLALLTGASWTVSADAVLYFAQTLGGAEPAWINIAEIGQANFTTSFPPSGTPTIDTDYSEIKNRITVHGGVVPSGAYADTFSGDGSTLRFTLTHKPVLEIIRITVDGVLQWHGYDYYDAQFNDYDCLVDYTLGTVRWMNPPGERAVIEVLYQYSVQLSYTAESLQSYTQFGRWFPFEIRDPSLTTLDACIAAADAYLAEYAFAQTSMSLDMEWWGVRAGQRVYVTYPTLGVSQWFPVRQATIELGRSTRRVMVSLRLGGRRTRLSRVIGGERGAGSLLGPPLRPPRPDPSVSGEVSLLRVRDRIELVDPNTTYNGYNDYGNATGIVLQYNPSLQKGQLLGLLGGGVQAYFDTDGTIKWGGGYGVLNSSGAYIGSTVFGQLGIQLESDSKGVTRAYIGDGGQNYVMFNGSDVLVGGGIYARYGTFLGAVHVGEIDPRIVIDGANNWIATTNYQAGSTGFRIYGQGNVEFNSATVRGAIYASSGHFSGSVYVGTASPRIHIDGTNKRIESTSFASGTSGFRIDGATGNAEFNNITARGAIASAVFTYNQVQATAGEIIVAKNAGKLRYDFFVSGGAGSLIIEDPPGISHAAAGTLWSVNDIVRLKDPGVGDSWFKVLAVTDQTNHWALLGLWQAGNTSVTFRAATAVVNYGQSGQGIVRIAAAGSYTPYVSLATHAGFPWATLTEKARLGNLDGIGGAAGYGLWTDNGFFTGVVQATTGLIGGWTIETGKLSAANVGMEPATYPFYAGDNKASDAPFRVTAAGALVATNATINGNITATSGSFTGAIYASSGQVGGWTIAATKLYSEDAGAYAGVGMASYQDAGVWAFWSGSNTPANAEFRVDKYGNLYATSATITGAITASSGSITGSLSMGSSGKITGGSAWELNQLGLLVADNVTAVQFGGVTSYMKLWTAGTNGGAIDTATYPLQLNGKTVTVNSNPANNGGVLQLRNNNATLIELQAAKLGFFGVTPVTRPAAYTFTNGAADRAINCTSTTLGEVANVLFTLWTDLKNLGLLQ